MIELLELKQSLIKNAACIRIIFQGQTKNANLLKSMRLYITIY